MARQTEHTGPELVHGLGYPKYYVDNDRIYYPGLPDSNLYLLTCGRVKLKGITPGGEETLHAVLSPLSLLGEHPGGLEYTHRLEASAVGSAQVLVIPRRKAAESLAADCRLSEVWCEALANDLDAFQRRAIVMDGWPIKVRLARALLELERNGTVGPFSQGEIAGYINTTRPTLNKTLRGIKGIIEQRYRYIDLRDFAELAKIAGAI